jgi:rod shape-determining protein MreD
MISDILKNILRFIILVLVQVLIIRNMDLGRYVVPFIYIMFIVMLPFETPNWLLLLLSFFTGIVIDMFYGTLGMHSAACVFIGFCRPGILKLFSPREGYEFGVQPTIQYLGVPWFVSYAAILTVLHHFVLFYIEVFRLSDFFPTFFRVICSSFVTLLLIVISQFLFYRDKQQQ